MLPYFHAPFYVQLLHPFHSIVKSHRAEGLMEMQFWNVFVGLKISNEFEIWNGTVAALDSESEQRWSFP